LVSALTRLGYAVDLATFPVGRDVEIPGVRLIRTANPLRFRHVRIGFTLRKLLLDVLLLVTAFRLLRRNEYFSIHGVEEGGFLAALMGRLFCVPVVYEMQSSLPQQLALRAFFRPRPVQAVLSACERWLVQHVDLVACSAGLADHVRGIAPGVPVQEWRYPIRQESASPGDAVELRASLGIAADAWVVMYSGTFEAYQGLADVVAAIPLAHPYIPRLFLVMVGASAGSAAELNRKAERAGVADRIRILPRCPVEEIARYHAMANVLLAPRAAGSNLPLKVYH
jgi:glycosyltransferase involved in cell wall biosynthesis